MVNKKHDEAKDPGNGEAVYDLDLDLDVESDPDTDEVMREAVAAVERRRGHADPDTEAPLDDPSAQEGLPEDERLAQLESEIAQLQERSLRTLADYENYRRRVARDKSEAKLLAEMGPLREVLPVVDNLDRALKATGGAEDLKKGVEMIHKQMLDVLARFGVEPVEAEGALFDPTKHEAVARDEDPSVSAPTVSAELQRGYVLGDRLLRPAMVRVAVPTGAPAEGEAEESR
jgi:molecular chaperone GrpE